MQSVDYGTIVCSYAFYKINFHFYVTSIQYGGPTEAAAVAHTQGSVAGVTIVPRIYWHYSVTVPALRAISCIVRASSCPKCMFSSYTRWRGKEKWSNIKTCADFFPQDVDDYERDTLYEVFWSGDSETPGGYYEATVIHMTGKCTYP